MTQLDSTRRIQSRAHRCRWPLGLALVAALLTTTATQAETLYVTDILRLGLHVSPNSSQKAIRTLISGDALEVLETTDFYVRVRTEAGDEGWVKTSYLVSDKPSLAQLREITKERDELSTELAALRSDAAQHNSQMQSLNAERESLEKNVAAATGELTTLRTTNKQLSDAVKANQFSVPLMWLIGISVVTLLAGFGSGWWYADAKQRARHGGYRI